MEEIKPPKLPNIETLLQQRLLLSLQFFNLFEVLKLEAENTIDSTSRMNICHCLKQGNIIFKTQINTMLQNMKTILGAKNKKLAGHVEPVWTAMKSDTNKFIKAVRKSEGVVNREQLDSVKSQFNMVLKSVFKLKPSKKKGKSKAEKYLDELRRVTSSSGNSVGSIKKLEQLGDQDNGYEAVSEEAIKQHGENIRRIVSGFSNLDKLERNKNPSIKAMSSDLMELGNGSYMEVQLTRLDFLEKNTDWVGSILYFHFLISNLGLPCLLH